MNPLDPSLTKPIIDQWGVYGVIMVVLVIAIIWLVKALIKSFGDRLAEQKDALTLSLKAQNDSTQVSRDVKASMDGMVRSFDAALAIVKGKT